MTFLPLLCFGTVDLARAYQLYTKVRNAAREGAAFGQFFPNNATSNCSGANGSTQYIVQIADNADSTFTPTSVSITDKNGATVTCSTVFSTGDTLKVTVTANFQLLTPVVSLFTGKSTYTLTASQKVVVQK